MASSVPEMISIRSVLARARAAQSSEAVEEAKQMLAGLESDGRAEGGMGRARRASKMVPVAPSHRAGEFGELDYRGESW